MEISHAGKFTRGCHSKYRPPIMYKCKYFVHKGFRNITLSVDRIQNENNKLEALKIDVYFTTVFI